MVVDREFAYNLFMCIYFVICCSPLNVFGPHFSFLGMTLGSVWLPWDAGRSLWGDLGFQGALLGVTLASFRLPWDASGTICGNLGSQVELGVTWGQKWTSVSVIIWSVCDACA